MSIIEEAAKRLKMLKQMSGGLFQSPQPPKPAAPSKPPVRKAPSIQKSAAAGGPRTVIPKGGKPGVVRSAPVEQAPPPAPPPRKPFVSRRVDVDLVQLAEKGLITPEAPRSQLAEEYRYIKRPLLGNVQGKGQAPVHRGNLIMVTSSIPGEGKTFTAINLAISIAMELDNTVLLVDADVSRPSVLSVLGLPADRGLMDVLLNDELELGDVMLKTNIEKLSIVPAGSAAQRATELLASEAMADLLSEMATRYNDRIIVFDSPPLLKTTEAPVLASHVGQVVLVVEAQGTPQSVVKQSLAKIQACPVVLAILNKAAAVDAGSYYDYYGGGYGVFGNGSA